MRGFKASICRSVCPSPDFCSGGGMRRSRPWKVVGIGLLAALCVGAVLAYRQFQPYAQIGGTYIAKQYCSCLFVTGRSERSCRTDLEPDIDHFKLTADRSGLPAHAKVTARLAFFTSEATYSDGYGCTVSK